MTIMSEAEYEAVLARITELAAVLLDAAGEQELSELRQAARIWEARLELG